MIKEWLFNYVNLWKLNTNAKAYREMRNKFDNLNTWQIHNKCSQKKRLRSRNQSMLVSTNLSVKCCLSVEKWAWDLNISTKCWYNRNLKTLKIFSNDDEISSKNLTFDILFAMSKMFVKLIFEFKWLLTTTTNMREAFEIVEKWCILRCEVDILIAKKDVTTKYVNLNKQAKL